MDYRPSRRCGCWFAPNQRVPYVQKSYLPLQGMQAHATIKDVSLRTVLTQTFSNDTNDHIKDLAYSFPLYDGVSVVSFTATIGDVRIHGVVKEKQQARREYQDAVDRGVSAGLLEQLPEASDVFVSKIGNVPAGAKIIVEVIYIGELKHDAESNGIRFTLPAYIAQRYGTTLNPIFNTGVSKTADPIKVTVDFQSPEGCPIQQIQSPSHPITVNVGRTTDMPTAAYMASRGFATLTLDRAELEKDFVVIASIKDAYTPKAFLETHPTFPNQRALMATLVPRFNIKPTYGEIVFIVDRSGSMRGKIETVIKAMTILLKSLPVGVKFNICSFGDRYSFLWPRSKSYDDETLSQALQHVERFDADYGGTQMLEPVKATIDARYADMHLDAIMLTDGQIWDQNRLFDLIRGACEDNKCRFFSLGIGSGASTALVEGISTAGNGYSQFVAAGEKMDMKMVRLLKGALTPHINDYSLEVKYKKDDEDSFEIIPTMKEEASEADITSEIETASTLSDATTLKTPISFFDNTVGTDDDGDVSMDSSLTNKDKFAHLPTIEPPNMIQAPIKVPPLYPFSRTTVYLLLDPSIYHMAPESVVLRATCAQGPLELEIKVEDIGKSETIHQLAAKRAVSEIEKDGGWLTTAKLNGTPVKGKYDGHWEDIREREAVRLGTRFQIAGRWCSFVAVGDNVEHETIVVEHEGAAVNESTQYSRAQLCSVDTRSADTRSANANARFADTSSFGNSRLSSRSALQSARTTKKCIWIRAPHWLQPLILTPRAAVRSKCQEVHRKAKAEENDDESFDQTVSYNSLDDRMRGVIRLQKSDGSWEWHQDLLDAMGISPSVTKQTNIDATALAIAFLQKRVPDEAASWELIVDKAKNWLSQQHGVDVEKEIGDAEKLLD
ncbi:von Willebrand factor type A domain-containing protein [Nemania sp. FL0916]|nr:von Willebrand factor type A domain-containing protein [Nemania sp. FL0916]